MLPTAKQLVAATGCTQVNADRFVTPLRDACQLYEIGTAGRLAAFMAQVGHESMGLSRTVENLNYSVQGLLSTWPSRFTRALAEQMARKPEQIANHVYGGRLGNHNPGDGWRYRGRGLIQVTGQVNYEGITETLAEKVGGVPDFTLHPELLESPKWAALSAAAYWDDHDLNELADRGAFDQITTRINGGQVGKADRRARYSRAMRVFGA
jgi:putative chitinase